MYRVWSKFQEPKRSQHIASWIWKHSDFDQLCPKVSRWFLGISGNILCISGFSLLIWGTFHEFLHNNWIFFPCSLELPLVSSQSQRIHKYNESKSQPGLTLHKEQLFNKDPSLSLSLSKGHVPFYIPLDDDVMVWSAMTFHSSKMIPHERRKGIITHERISHSSNIKAI